MKTGIDLIAAERLEQQTKHGKTIESDMRNNGSYELAAAASYLITPQIPSQRPVGWDKAKWLKMIGKEYKQRLIIAGALIAAEIDRIQKSDSNEK